MDREKPATVLRSCEGRESSALTFARRRHAYLAAGALFALVEMVVVTLAVPLAPRVGLWIASLATAIACFIVYARGPWSPIDARMAE